MTAPLLYDVWYLNQILRHSISEEWLPYIGDNLDAEGIHSFYAKNYRKMFLHTDYKKSGLTMPHWFTQSVIDVLHELDPSLEIGFPSEGWPILDPKTGKVYRPNGYGYGLGMINNIYTIFNIVMFKIGQEDEIFSENDQIVSFNDDSAIATENDSYYRWISLINQTGAWVDKNKSFSGYGMMFLEQYNFHEVDTSWKWSSFFSTLLSMFWKAANYHHWRFLVTDAWFQSQIGPIDAGSNPEMSSGIEQYMREYLYSPDTVHQTRRAWAPSKDCLPTFVKLRVFKSLWLRYSF